MNHPNSGISVTKQLFIMKHQFLGLLVLCAFSLVCCKENDAEKGNDRCNRKRPHHHHHDGNSGPKRPGGPPQLGHEGDDDDDHDDHPAMIVAPPACKDFVKAVHDKVCEMRKNKELGECPEPKSCDECKFDDYLKARNQVQVPVSPECQQQIDLLLKGGETVKPDPPK